MLTGIADMPRELSRQSRTHGQSEQPHRGTLAHQQRLHRHPKCDQNRTHAGEQT